MGLANAVEWWDESQLLVLVICSLFIQYFLAFSARGRKVRVPSWYRLFIWLSFIGSDAVALYALATLFKRYKEQRPGSSHAHGSHDLEVFWAPILLMHLGGQVFITAYNIEDNERWQRHLFTGLSQVALALYVFCKSWPSSADKRLLAAAILLFISGVFRCLSKPWAVGSATYMSLVRYSVIPSPKTKTSNMRRELDQYVSNARHFIACKQPVTEHQREVFKRCMGELFGDFRHIYPARYIVLKVFLVQDSAEYQLCLKDCLSTTFDTLYTKKKSVPEVSRSTDSWSSRDGCGAFTSSFSFFLPLAAIVLFHTSHKKTFDGTDVIVTFVLLYCIFFLEIISDRILELFANQWPDTVDQESIIGYFARNKKKKILMSIASGLQCKDLVDQYFGMEPCNSSQDITSLVRQHVLDGWKVYIRDAESYREFGDFRGQWTLEFNKCNQLLTSSLEKPFDESILLWHLATDFCFHETDTSANNTYARRCREISNYMIHLLFANPDLLMAGSRKNLFKIANKELDGFFYNGMKIPTEEKEVAKKVVEKLKRAQKTGFVSDAWVLAEGLMALQGKMWQVIQGVWIEMLCFSASRSRGYLHAKSLGTGGEFLSYVWLLLAHAGLETFPEKLQRTVEFAVEEEQGRHSQDAASQGMEFPVEEDNAADSSADQGNNLHSEEEAHSTSSSPKAAGTDPELEIIVAQ